MIRLGPIFPMGDAFARLHLDVILGGGLSALANLLTISQVL
jgi:hypothetical protein